MDDARETSRSSFELLESFGVEKGLLGEVYDRAIGIKL